jgi:hypothetical protein
MGVLGLVPCASKVHIVPTQELSEMHMLRRLCSTTVRINEMNPRSMSSSSIAVMAWSIPYALVLAQ